MTRSISKGSYVAGEPTFRPDISTAIVAQAGGDSLAALRQTGDQGVRAGGHGKRGCNLGRPGPCRPEFVEAMARQLLEMLT